MLIDGFWWMAATIAVAGIVRGFTGFGTALIFVPVAGRFLAPAEVIAVITLTGFASTAALLPRAWGKADRRDVAVLLAATVPAVPLGLWAQAQMPVEAVRWTVAAAAAVTLAALVSGWRYGGRLGRGGLIGVGGGAGLLGGMTGLTGPVVILAYLASRAAAVSVRANTILFLAGLDLVILVNIALAGLAEARLVIVAALLSVPYFAAALVGQALFDPARERLYRGAAYAVIAGAVITGLPLWDG